MRSREFEADYLTGVVRESDDGVAREFAAEFNRRMAKGESEYEQSGNGFHTRTFLDLLAEQMEECVDAAAWGALDSQVLEGHLRAADRDHLLRMIEDVGADAFSMWSKLRLAAEFYGEAKERAESPLTPVK